MITVFNANDIAQQWFFKKAYNTLKENNLLTNEEQIANRFLSLDGYFAHMKDLILLNPIYAMLPTDESPFVIDANARTITIPASFNKCAGVAGDNMCEIVTFTIDRFYDYVDLANTSICIQWSTSKGEEGISHITLIDTETIPGKIRFGWPLTLAITKEAGPVSFAVRFVMKEEGGAIKYILNTLKTSIIIREGLKISNEDFVEEFNTDLFSGFIKNSNNPSQPIPAQVHWGTPGLDLPTTEKIGTNNRFELKAQAIVDDNGHLQYNWYFKSDDSEDSLVRDLTEEVKLNSEDPCYEINEIYEEVNFEAGKPRKRNGSEQYFEKIIDKDVENYVLVIGDLDSVENQTKTPLYERYTVLTLKDDSGYTTKHPNITGKYWVGASNYVGDRYFTIEKVEDGSISIEKNEQNHTPETTGTECKIAGPKNVTFSIDVEDDKFIETYSKKTFSNEIDFMNYNGAKFIKNADGTYKEVEQYDLNTTEYYIRITNLKIKPEIDNGNPDLSYSWYFSGTEIENATNDNGELTGTVLEGKNTSEIITDNPGWYFGKITSKLNRKEKFNYSNVCRAIYPVEAPKLEEMKFYKFDNYQDEFNKEDLKFTVLNMDVIEGMDAPSIGVELGNIIRLKVVTDLDNADKLKSDELVYDWYYMEPNTLTSVKLTEEFQDQYGNGLVHELSPLNKNYIDIRCIKDLFGDSYHQFYCKVTNKLNGTNAILDQTDYSILFKLQ